MTTRLRRNSGARLVIALVAVCCSAGACQGKPSPNTLAAIPQSTGRQTSTTTPTNPDASTVTHVLADGRTFLLHSDAGGNQPKPLIVALHMASHSAAQMESTGLSTFGDAEHLDVAYGEGVHGYWNAGGCCGDDTANDLLYLRQVVTAVEGLANIDRSRVYVVGMSNGGMMAYRAVCEEPDIFAAAGVVAGALMPGVNCAHTDIHVIEIHGTRDNVVPLHGGKGYDGIVFPAQSTDLSRAGPGSTITLHTWDGYHEYPTWANSLLWATLSKYRLS
jgi:poly(3-hydroxybutyrate) depolymerase